MSRTAVYFVADGPPDPAIQKGITGAGCRIQRTRSIPETIDALKDGAVRDTSYPPALLVAEVQSGAIPLLALLQEQRIGAPPVILLDREGRDIHTVIRALKFDAADYLLADEPELQREIRARIIAERAMLAQLPAGSPVAAAEATPAGPTWKTFPGFRWDPALHVVYVNGAYIRLSPVEGRLFDLLASRRNRTVPMPELIAAALGSNGIDTRQGARLLRPHMMRLRNKLLQHPELAHRIVNMRGSGYMFV
jgi:DNA-binding response OmpR family regulator